MMMRFENAEPEETAKAGACFASDAAHNATGSIIVVDGGATAHTGRPEIARFAELPVG